MKTASLLVCLVLIFGFSGGSVFACTQDPNAAQPSLEELVETAHIILVGTVLDNPVYEDMGRPVIVQATIEVEAYLKGEGAAEVVISDFGSSSLCQPEILEGRRASFFVFERPEGLSIWRIYNAEAADIEAIRAVTNQFLVPQGAIVPSITPSATSSATMTATRRPTNVASFPSPTKTATSTHTVTATMTASATVTLEASITPTELILPPAPAPLSAARSDSTPPSSDSNLLYALGFGLMGIAIVGMIALIVRRRGV
jgi:hypothetical protein